MQSTPKDNTASFEIHGHINLSRQSSKRSVGKFDRVCPKEYAVTKKNNEHFKNNVN